MQLAIEHITHYAASAPVGYRVQTLRLTPSSFAGQQVVRWSVTSDPSGPMTLTADGFGNTVAIVTIEAPHHAMTLRAAGLVEVTDTAGVVTGLPERAPPRVFLRTTPLTAADAGIAALLPTTGRPGSIDWLHGLMAAIRARVDYQPGTTDAKTSAIDALKAGAGVCQDHTHIFIAAARVAQVPARYVTGYLLIPAERAEPAHHAWAEALVEGLGWVGFDVANGICPTDHYVRLAAGLDARGAAPIRGLRRGSEAESLAVSVRVEQQQSAQQ